MMVKLSVCELIEIYQQRERLTVSGVVSANVPVGLLYTYENGLFQNLTSTGTYYSIRDLSVCGVNNVTADNVTSTFTIDGTYAGLYEVKLDISYGCDKTAEIHGSLHINTVHQDYSSFTTDIVNVNKNAVGSFHGYYDLEVGDILTVMVKTDSANTLFKSDKIQFSIKRIGDLTGQFAPET